MPSTSKTPATSETICNNADQLAPNSNTPHQSYPVHLVLAGKKCLVVGGGRVAVHKTAGLLAAGAEVVVVAPRILLELTEQATATSQLRLANRRYRRGELADYRLAITCTDDPDVNRQVYEDGERHNVWVNSADDPTNCMFTLPSVARQGDLSISVSTNGKSPALAAWLRRRFETEFDESYSKLLDVLAEVRRSVRQTHGTSEMPGWDKALDSGLLRLVSQGKRAEARQLITNSLGVDSDVFAIAEPAQERL